MSYKEFRDIKKEYKRDNYWRCKNWWNNPITVQTMTNTLTTNVETIKQINHCTEKVPSL